NRAGRGAGKEQELVALVRADIANDSAVILFIKEPLGTRPDVHPVRPESYCLNDLAYGSGLHQFACFHRSAVFESLAIHYGVYTSGFLLNAANLFQLIQRDDPGLVYHEVLAVFHDADTQRRTVERYRRADDELNACIFKDFLLAARQPGVRKAF